MNFYPALALAIGVLAFGPWAAQKADAVAPGYRAPAAKTRLAAVPSDESTVEQGFIRNVRDQLSISMDLPASEFMISVESFRITPEADVKNIKSVQILGLGTKRIDGLFSLPILVQSENIAQEFQATGVLKVIGPVFTAKRTLNRGETISGAELSKVVLPWSTLPTGAAGVPLRKLTGQRVRNFVPSGDAVYPALLDEPYAVRFGDTVELTLMSGPGVMIRSRAVAKQEGRLGESIRIEQPDTKKMLNAEIVGHKSVEVRL